MTHVYFPACHLLVWYPYFSLLNHLSSLCLGRSYYLFNLKSLLALFPKARLPFINFSIFPDVPRHHNLWWEHEFPMEVLATRGFKNTFPLPAVDSLGSFKTQVCPASQSSTSEPFLGMIHRCCRPHNGESERCSDVCHSLRLYGLYSPWDSPGQNTGVGSCSLL